MLHQCISFIMQLAFLIRHFKECTCPTTSHVCSHKKLTLFDRMTITSSVWVTVQSPNPREGSSIINPISPAPSGRTLFKESSPVFKMGTMNNVFRQKKSHRKTNFFPSYLQQYRTSSVRKSGGPILNRYSAPTAFPLAEKSPATGSGFSAFSPSTTTSAFSSAPARDVCVCGSPNSGSTFSSPSAS
jgi:hypothetical protein